MRHVFMLISTTYYGNGYKAAFLEFIIGFVHHNKHYCYTYEFGFESDWTRLKYFTKNSATMTCSKIVYNKKYHLFISNF